MRLHTWALALSTGLMVVANPLIAQPQSGMEQLQMSRCLAKALSKDYTVLAENGNFKILNVPAADVDSITLTADKLNCGRFINVSHKLPRLDAAQSLLNQPAVSASKLVADTYEIKHQEAVEAAIAKIEPQNIWDTLTHLTNYQNRSATKDTGVEAANWLKSRFDAMATETGHQDTDSYLVKTGSYKQPSVVTVIGKDIQAPAVVIGAHMDTLDGRMPGAGDDGSGSSTVMEMTRVLLASQQTFKRPIYIIWYAAEERGLVGSQYVVKDFLQKKIPVKAVIQFDMTGYRNDQADPTLWVYRDYTDKALSDYVVSLIETYVKVPVKFSKCGYGCSDHASWTEKHIPAAFPCETSFAVHNPYIHTSADTMSLLNLEHMTNFTKLALSFAIELASE